MTTLYIRDVPEPVAEALKERAAQQGQSLSAYVGAQLAMLAERPTNAQIVEQLRRIDRAWNVDRQDVLDELAASRR